MLRGWGSSLWIFPRKAGLSLHFTDSKSDYPGYSVMAGGGGAGVSNDWCIKSAPFEPVI